MFLGQLYVPGGDYFHVVAACSSAALNTHSMFEF